MTYEPHTYVTFSGTVQEKGTADELWQIGIRGFNPTTTKSPVDASQLQALVDAIFNDLSSWWTAAAAPFGQGTFLRQIKAVNIGPDGRYSSQPRTHAVTLGGNATGTGFLPSFCSIAYSWQTEARTGKAARGRVYPPNFTVPFNDGLATVPQATVDRCLTNAKQLLTLVSKSGSQFVFRPYVVSASGVSRPITGVRVGNVIDVQRRRRDAQPETYTRSDWTPPS